MLGLGHNIATPMVSGEIPYSNDYYYTGTHATAQFVDTNSAMQSLFRSDWTFSGWFNLDDGQTNPPNALFGAKHDSNNHIFVSTTKNDSKLYIDYKANGDVHSNITSAIAWSDGATGWFHIAITMSIPGSGNVSTVTYVNGSAVATTTTNTCTILNAGSFTNTQGIYIGGIYSGGAIESLRGDMDDVAFHSKALSASEVSDIYNGGVSIDLTTHGASSDLVHYYTFNEQSGKDFGSGESNATFAEEGYSFNAHSSPTSAP